MSVENKLMRDLSIKDDPVRELLLHKAAYHNDHHTLLKIIRQNDIAEKDVHGNTALHIAVMFGYKECVSILLSHNAPIKIKNLQGWTPLAEAISYGDRHMVTSLLRKLKKQSRESLHTRKEHLLHALENLGDFYLELKWDFQSWIPLVSKILPSDVCKIYKQGTCLRMDTTLVDFNDRSWERGDISFIFDSDAKPGDALVILDNKAKVFQRIKYEETELEVEDEVDLLLSSDVVNAQISTKSIHFTRTLSGWIWRHERSETVGEYEADFYNVEGLCLETKKRREHLSFDDVKKNKALVQSLINGNIDESDLKITPRRKSLPPPPRPVIPWEDYLNHYSSGNPPNLGRPQLLKESNKHFKATVAMSDHFPMSVEALLDILEIVAPFKHLNKLRTFCKVRLPPGFPVKIELPLLPTISAKITFQKLVFKEHTQKRLFAVPSTYREDSHRFPDL